MVKWKVLVLFVIYIFLCKTYFHKIEIIDINNVLIWYITRV